MEIAIVGKATTETETRKWLSGWEYPLAINVTIVDGDSVAVITAHATGTTSCGRGMKYGYAVKNILGEFSWVDFRPVKIPEWWSEFKPIILMEGEEV